MTTTIDPTLLQLLVLAASAGTTFLVGRVFKKMGDMATDLKEIRGKVDGHAEQIATLKAKVEELERWRDRTERSG